MSNFYDHVKERFIRYAQVDTQLPGRLADGAQHDEAEQSGKNAEGGAGGHGRL